MRSLRCPDIEKLFISLSEANNFIQTIEKRQGLKIGCPEEIAWKLNYINDDQLEEIAQKYITSLFVALSEDAFKKSFDLKKLVKESQTPKGLNEQGLKNMAKKGVYKSAVNTLNAIYKRLNR